MPPSRSDRGPTLSDPALQTSDRPAASGVVSHPAVPKWHDETLIDPGAPTAAPALVPALSPDYPAIAQYGRYEILGRLAVGGMAEVFLARESGQHNAVRHVAIKRILPQIADDETFVEMFLDEARLAIQLNHPNVCHIYDFGEEDDSFFIAMEWVNGVAFGKVIRRAREFGLIPPAVAVKVIGHVAEALHHAHQARDGMGRPMNIVHRDVSPQNIMVRFDGVVKLLDFGIAKNATQTSQTEAGVVKGKFSYMAPEQCLGRPLDARTDIFALGSCLYEALTGRPAFRRASDLETMRAIVHEQPTSIDEFRPHTSPALLRIVDTAMAKDPKDRFQTAGDMYVALERFLASEDEFIRAMHISQYVETLMPGEAAAGPLSHLQVKEIAVEMSEPTEDSTTGELIPQPYSDDAPTLQPGMSPAPPPQLSPARPTKRPPGQTGAKLQAVTDRHASSSPSHSALPRLATAPSVPPKPAVPFGDSDFEIKAPPASGMAPMPLDDGPTEQMDKAAIAAALAELDHRRKVEDGFQNVSGSRPPPAIEIDGSDFALPGSGPASLERPARPSFSRTRAETERVVTGGTTRKRRGSRVLLGSLLVAVVVIGVGLGVWYHRAGTGFPWESSDEIAPHPGHRSAASVEARQPDPSRSAPETKAETQQVADESPVVENANAGLGETNEAAQESEAVEATSPDGDPETVGAQDEDRDEDVDGLTGQLTIVTRPRAIAFLDGERIGKTPIRNHEVPEGAHELELRDLSGNRYERTIRIESGTTKDLFYRLGR